MWFLEASIVSLFLDNIMTKFFLNLNTLAFTVLSEFAISFRNYETLLALGCFTVLSGFGVLFLNSETLLAFCFFIFLAFCLHHSTPFYQNLQQSTEAVQTALLRGNIHGSKLNVVAKKEKLAKLSQLLASIKALTTK